MDKTILFEGWRGINHSYAMVNQYQILEFCRANASIYHNDLPYFRSEWSSKNNPSGFSNEESRIISSVTSLNSDATVDVTYRISFPYRLNPPNKGRLFVYGTSEYQAIPKDMIHISYNYSSYEKFEGTIITPSHWSKEGFLNSGFKYNQVKVVSHGVDTNIFKPIDKFTREQDRLALGIGRDDFIVLSVGAMGHNKGIDILLSAYILLKKKYPQLKLVLKDQKSLYHFGANEMFNQFCRERNIDISDVAKNSFIKDIIVISGNLSLVDLNRLYGLADCYVSPYRAEGFNLPPLEAAAAGTPIIVTAGGSTDEYFDKTFALKIDSKKKRYAGGNCLEPNVESLTEKIEMVINNSCNDLNLVSGRKKIHEKFSWEISVKKLKNLFDE